LGEHKEGAPAKRKATPPKVEVKKTSIVSSSTEGHPLAKKARFAGAVTLPGIDSLLDAAATDFMRSRDVSPEHEIAVAASAADTMLAELAGTAADGEREVKGEAQPEETGALPMTVAAPAGNATAGRGLDEPSEGSEWEERVTGAGISIPTQM
jgi:hypothetical protein